MPQIIEEQPPEEQKRTISTTDQKTIFHSDKFTSPKINNLRERSTSQDSSDSLADSDDEIDLDNDNSEMI